MSARQRKSYSPLLAYIAEVPEVMESDLELIDRFRRGDPAASFLLFVKHHRMVLQVILELTHGRWFNDDCLQAGGVGLYEAAKRFDPGRGNKFLTYAVPWIYKFVVQELANEVLPMGGIAIGRDQKSRLYKYIGLKITGLDEDEIQRTMRVSDKEIKKLATLAVQLSRPASLDADPSDTSSTHSGHHQEFAVYAEDGCPSINSAEDEFIDDYEAMYTMSLINNIENAKLRYILNATYGVNGVAPQDNRAIAKSLGLTMPQFHYARREAIYQLKVVLRNVDQDRYQPYAATMEEVLNHAVPPQLETCL